MTEPKKSKGIDWDKVEELEAGLGAMTTERRERTEEEKKELQEYLAKHRKGGPRHPDEGE